MRYLFLFTATLAFASEATQPTVSAANAIQQPAPISAELQFQMAILMKQAEILRLQVCSEAGIKHTECVVDWQRGTVSKRETAVKPPVKQ